MSALDITDVEKSFGHTRVLRGVDLRVADGTLGALLGPSGCGKTTLLRLVAGFERADAGRIRVGDRTLADAGRHHLRPERRNVGIVPQEGALFPHLSVLRNVVFGLRGRARLQRRARAEEVLDLVGLADHAARMPHELSGGQQQRVALARALAPEPGLVLLDEPFNALDPALRSDLRDEVRRVLRAAGVTGLLVTHDPEEALSTADTVALMRAGEIVQTGTPREVYERPQDAGLASYLGETVTLPGRKREGAVECALGTLAAVDPGVSEGGPGTVLVRPERIDLAPAAAHDDTGSDTRGAQVTRVRFAGHDSLVELLLEGTDIVVRARTHMHPFPRVGDRVRVRVVGPVMFYPGTASSAPVVDAYRERAPH
ncbi:ABC transporter ATP-binding protein [Nocardiopsis sp. MG754419]|uniref:ABC transporter ATP-binding protein n=1 Tax=Nocardiopsis sp. MG754419 TaxID=2259865 RepID=UPI001BA8D377|nr:ABC transporter ATP-binding protein [Nocardiopsis sp. MG754419]MBR8741824.1 ABC transporter ATP-binding protein [Nocardiopsis sp. MG754419]